MWAVKIALLLFFILAISACCGDRLCQLHKQFQFLSREEANNRFSAMSAKDQVDIYVWELNNTRPVASPYEFILKENGEAVSAPLLNAANHADGYLVQTALLASLSGLRPEDRRSLPLAKLKSAIERCKFLAGHEDDSLCVTYEREIMR